MPKADARTGQLSEVSIVVVIFVVAVAVIHSQNIDNLEFLPFLKPETIFVIFVCVISVRRRPWEFLGNRSIFLPCNHSSLYHFSPCPIIATVTALSSKKFPVFFVVIFMRILQDTTWKSVPRIWSDNDLSGYVLPKISRVRSTEDLPGFVLLKVFQDTSVRDSSGYDLSEILQDMIWQSPLRIWLEKDVF